MISSGIVELDALTCGLPRGCLAEICGSPSSGKTSVLLATIAAATQRGESCVLIDASDSFDPISAAAAGMDFSKLLWVRCGKSSSALGRRSSAKDSSRVVGRASCAKNRHIRVPHPCLASFARQGGVFDFVYDTRQMTHDESFSYDLRRTTYDDFADDRGPKTDDNKRALRNHEGCLEQVLKSADLILQSGGFGLVALDLAGIPEKFVRRIPLASWFRFQRAVEYTKTALLVVSENPCAQACAAIVIKVCGKPSAVSHQLSGKLSHRQLLKEIQIEAELLRSRLDRKSMQSVKADFTTHAVRAG
jgi:recombination protein RecA